MGIAAPTIVQLDDLHLSPLVTTDFIQLLPDRLATVTRPSADEGVIDVRVFGHGAPSWPDQRAPAFEVLVERLAPGADPTLERLACEFSLEPIPAHEAVTLKPKGGPASQYPLDLGAGIAKEGLAETLHPGALDPHSAAMALPDMPLMYAVRVRLKTKKAQVRVSVLEYETHRTDPAEPSDTPTPDLRRRLVYFDEFDV